MAVSGGSLRRSRSDKMIAGVMGGIARYFGFSSTITRIIFVVLSVVSVAFPGIIVYVLLWLLMPQDSE